MTAASITTTHVRAARPRRHASCPRPSATTPPSRTATLDPTAALAAGIDATPPPSRAARAASRTSPATRSPRDRTWTFTTAAGRRRLGCPCSIWGTSATPANAAETATRGPLEVGVKFRSQIDGKITGAALLQGRDEHRHPRRAPVDAHRHAAGQRHVHQRDRDGLAGGRLLVAGRDHRGHDLRRVLLRPARQLRRRRELLRGPRRRQRAAARPGRRRGRRQRRLRLRRARHLPHRHLPDRATTGSTSCSRTTARTRARRRVTAVLPAPRRHRRQPGRQRQRHASTSR